MPQNVLANGSEITVDIPIRVPQDSNSQCLKLFIAMSVRHFMLGKLVLSSVDLYCKHVAVDIEVNDIVPNVFLSVYGERETFQEKIPKLSFCIGHVVAEIFCEGDELFVMIKWHISGFVRMCDDGTECHVIGRPSSVTATPCHLPPREGKRGEG